MSSEESPDYPFAKFLEQHSDQLNSSAVPPELWHSLYKKLIYQRFDAGDYFQIICEISDDGDKNMTVQVLEDMHNVEEDSIFLIDHLFTFENEKARAILESSDDLLYRLADLFGIEYGGDSEEKEEKNEEAGDAEEGKLAGEVEEGKTTKNVGEQSGILPRHESVDARLGYYNTDETENSLVEKVLRELWKHTATYTVRYNNGNSVESKSLWYVMDEFGGRIRHSSEPNVRVVPLMYLPEGCAYSVMFLTRPLLKDEEVYRDFAENVLSAKNPEWRKYMEIPWVPNDFSDEPSLPNNMDDNFFSSGRIPDTLATSKSQEISNSAIITSLPILRKRKLKIFADDTQLVQHLNREYELVDDWKKADVIWLMKHFHDFGDLCEKNPCGMINQFPYESCLTVKDLMAACAMRNHTKNNWYQLTYNLNTQLPQFVACFQKRAKNLANGEKNVWIVKPWNLARGLEICVTDDLNKIIRLVESGPKIVCEYISRPLLFPRPDNGNQVKFDLRYIVFVNSFRPVSAYIYNKFWIRFAINEFTMGDFDDMETHFTVFNYVDNANKILQMKCDDFIETIEKTYPKIKWSNVQKDINRTIRLALEVASEKDAPSGVAPNVQSRAMFGVDIMLQHLNDDVIKPTLLEVNFMPDCTRACEYYSDFADVAFNTMFLDEIDPSNVSEI